MDNKKVQRNLFAVPLQNELKRNVAHFTTYVQTRLAANQVVPRFENVLHKLESTLLFATKSLHFARFTSPRQTCLAASDANPV